MAGSILFVGCRDFGYSFLGRDESKDAARSNVVRNDFTLLFYLDAAKEVLKGPRRAGGVGSDIEGNFLVVFCDLPLCTADLVGQAAQTDRSLAVKRFFLLQVHG